MKLCGIIWQKTAYIIHLKFRVEDIFVGGTTLGNKMGMLYAVAVIPYTLFYTVMLLIMQSYSQ